MDPDTTDAAWAQLENEAREYNEILANDQGYEIWLNELEKERTNEVCSESQQGF
jgi:hypothetical protein